MANWQIWRNVVGLSKSFRQRNRDKDKLFGESEQRNFMHSQNNCRNQIK